MRAERNRWGVLVALAAYQIFLFGPSVATLGVFFDPLMREFHWSHAEVSLLASALEVSLGVSSLLAGWLLDRVDARWVMSAGAAIAGAGFLAASQSHSLPVLIVCYAAVGLGVSMGFLVALAVLASNWFPDRTGLAIGIGNVGIALGLALSPRIIAAVVGNTGWRIGMMAAGLPMLVIAAPVALLFLRTRPAGTGRSASRHAAAGGGAQPGETPGLGVMAALGTLPMWLMILIMLLFQYGLGAVYFHTIPYLLSVGFSVGTATLVFGAPALLYGVGGILWGAAADRLGPRRVIFCAFTLFALSVPLLLAAGPDRRGVIPLLVYMVLWGLDSGAIVAIPVLLAHTMGKRSYAGLNGVLSFASQAGQGLGPLIAGVLIDSTRGYTLAFAVATGAILISALLGPMVRKPTGHESAV